MDTQTLDSFRSKLLRRGQALLGGDHAMAAPLLERGREQEQTWSRQSEWSDPTTEQIAAMRRTRVKESEDIALIRIQASLARIAQGTFGDCVICHAPIETERLRAIPEVDRCGGCTH